MRIYDAVAAGDLVDWQSPWARKPGKQPARVLDVAGPWVLVSPLFGNLAGRQFWTLVKKLHVPPPHPEAWPRALLKQAGILPYEEGDPNPVPSDTSDAWLTCLVCEGTLYGLGYKDDAKRIVGMKKWLYCPSCDRTQRVP